MKVYLAGKIEDLPFSEATEWRQRAKRYLEDYGIGHYDPTKHAMEYLFGGVITGRSTERDGKIFTQDVHHIYSSDVILVRLNKGTPGTLIELGMAYCLQIPVVAFDTSSDLRSHPFIQGTVDVFCANLEEALDYIVNL